jgi:hypothetical protein
MLHSHSKAPPFFPDAGGSPPAGAVPPPLGGNLSDAAIDATLCRVTLPDGLLSRLQAMAGTLTDDGGNPLD